MPQQPATAYSYVRFSSPEQLKGDSLRRQTAATAEWCRRNGITLDTTLSLRDLGVSAFRGAHRAGDKHRLGQFLKLVNQGRIAKGSYLVIENLDRLSREEERPALRLWMDILDAGINIVQLTPETVFRHEKSDMMDIMRAIIELSRGHSESRMKSKRNGAAWEEKWRRARAGEKMPPRRKDGRVSVAATGTLPAWLRENGGGLELVPARAAAVRRIYALAASGLGKSLIARALADEGHEPMGPSGEWGRTYIGQILHDRRAAGELQPRHANGRPAGDPLPGYYPACVSEAEWLAARAAMDGRAHPAGRVGKYVNVFAGLLKNARDGEAYHVGNRSPKRKTHRVLLAARAPTRGTPCHSFPLETFEKAVLSLLKEVNPKDVLGAAPGQDEVIALSNELTHVKARQQAIEAELMKGGEVSALAKAGRALDDRQKELTEQLAAAQRKASYPAGEAWGEMVSLADVLQAAPDAQEREARRLRLRALLRQLVDEIWVLVVGRGRDRLAAVQIYFRGDGHRDYLILSRPPKAGRGRGAEKPWREEGGWWARSLATVTRAGDLDLRNRDHARQLEAVLAAVPLADTNSP
jgi:DNA invertase Pin-like site-specific DNA recombinase